ncbi:TonB-dependent receptor [Sphingobium sp. YR768]|uniref:TonB-dependent receptor n=1 Tax=Sphingobium sp. YR768 TaxID=1884365 RepID=UPI0008C0D559|nr:TonB-dependent receptor [Sphingobium sp. YR768]SES12053.1 hemoglobin/transferrin/lactoferrin receptor protein [Sphingobium sp. YR768]
MISSSRYRTNRNLVLAWLATTTLSIGAFGGAKPAYAQEAASYDIPAGPLSTALNQFARQAKVELIYDAPLTQNAISPGLKGNYDTTDALSLLLGESGVTFRRTGARVFTLARAQQTAVDGSTVTLGPLQVEGERTARDNETGVERDARRKDEVYDKDISSTFASREEVERYKGTNPADVLKGMVNVFSGDARNSGALDPSIRGIQGPGRVPVIIDGTEQAITIWRGYNGAGNRSYIDPSLISGIQVLKGPVSERGVNGSTGGAVVVNTLDAADILKPGQTFGIKVKLEGGNNSTNPRWPTLSTGLDYRDVPGFLGTGTGFSSPTFPYNDQTLRVTLRSPDDNEAFSFGDRAIRLAVAGRVGDFDLFGAYAFRERGNYFTGKSGAGYYQQEELLPATGVIAVQNYVPTIGLFFRPGYEVPNTSSEMESFLFKGTWRIADDQSLQLGFRDSKSTYGEVLPSRLMNATGFGNIQWPASKVHIQAYNAEYTWKPESPWIDLKVSVWATDSVSDTYSAGGFPNSAGDYTDPIIINSALANARNDRFGITASNQFTLSSRLGVVVEGNWQHEKLRSDDEYSAAMANGARQLPRAGRREEYRLNLRGEWRPASFLKLNAGISYSGYWAKDDFLPKLIDLSGGSIQRVVTTSYRTSYRINENGRIRTITGPVWAPDEAGNYRRADNICLNGFLTSVANSTGWCSVSLNQATANITEASRKSDSGWMPSASATVYLSGASRLYARYAEALRFPSMFESTIGFSASINPSYHLKPERLRSWEAAYIQDMRQLFGLNGEGQHADLKLSWYHNTTRNVIERNNQFMFTNVDRQTIAGFELQARFDNGRIFADIGAGHMTKNRVCDASVAVLGDPNQGRIPDCVKYGFPAGYLLTQATPETSVNLHAGAWFFERRLELGGRMAWYSEYDNPPFDAFLDQGVPGLGLNIPYSWGEIVTLDAYAKFRLNDRFSAELVGMNLNNRYYLDPLSRSLNPAPGRTVRLSLTGRF